METGNTEAQENFLTRSELSVEITHPKRHFKRIGKVLILLVILHQVSIESLVEKMGMRQITVIVSHTLKIDMPIMRRFATNFRSQTFANLGADKTLKKFANYNFPLVTFHT